MSQEFVPDYTVKPFLFAPSVRVSTVQRRRHSIVFCQGDEERESRVTYCNNCGSPYITANTDDPEGITRCSNCGLPQQ